MRIAVNRRVTFVLVAALVVAGSLGISLYTLWHLRGQTIERQLETAALTARALEDHLTQSFNVIDRMLVNAAHDESGDLTRTLRQAPYLRSISLLDAAAVVRASSTSRNIGIHVAMTDFLPPTDHRVEVLRAGPLQDGRDFFEARPVGSDNLGPTLSFIPVARDVLLADNRWLTVMGSVNTDYFLNFYTSHVTPDTGMVQLLRYDGTLLLSTSETDRPGLPGNSGTILASMTESEYGRFEERLENGRDMLTAYRASRAYPFVLVVRFDKEMALAVWRNDARNTFAVVCTVLLAALAMAARYFVRFERVASEQRQFQERLRIAAIAFESQQGMVITDANAVVLQVNQAFTNITGYAPEDAMGREMSFLKSGQHAPAFYAAIKASLVLTDAWSGEIMNRHKDGSIHPHFLTITAVRDEAGQVTHHVGTLTDITTRKAAEETLRTLSRAVEQSPVSIVITDPAGDIQYVNPKFESITGYTSAEVVGNNPRILSSKEKSATEYKEMWTTITSGRTWQGEFHNRRKDGSLFWEMASISPVFNDAGNLLHFVAVKEDVTKSKEHERHLEHIAHYDALTGLPNRVLLADRLQHALAQTHRRKQQLAVAYLDLDGFKAINDQYGHDTGDLLLIAVADRMRQVFREADTLARLGGDEFVAVLPDLSDVSASIPMLSRLLDAAAQPVQIGDTLLQVSASVGVTFYPQADDVDADQLLRQADQAMYHAKLAGKNRYHIFDAEQDRSVRGRHESLEHIRLALQEGQFVLHYQPKVNMRSGQVIGAEALIRWQHPEKGLLHPAMFLPVIEDHPLAVKIDDWVIEAALTQMEIWQGGGFDVPVSVNIGARQLLQADFAERLHARLAAHPLVKPSQLELEVLETSALEDLVRVSQLISDCREFGVTFALDDFGTGYSSLTYLKRLAVAQLKIDQSFVRNMLNDPDDLAILDGVIGLATAFRRQVIAEGVETVEHGELLLRLGCELAQGYGIARPMPANELPRWAAAWRPDPRWAGCVAVSRSDFPLLVASAEHRAWVSAIENYLAGLRDQPPTLSPSECRFGLWVQAEGRARHGDEPTFEAIEVLHQQIHVLAEELCALKLGGQGAQALSRLAELHVLRTSLLEQLGRLFQHG